MSSFLCQHCHTEIIDSDQGYVTGCAHWPLESEPKWLSRDCQLYTGKCSCQDGEPRCAPG